MVLGNAESREEPHGRFSEPLGGWLSVDPDSSQQWETRGGPARGRGCCVFFDGRKSPAITEVGGERKYPFLINQRQIDDALAYHGRWGQGITPAVMKRCHWVEPVLVAQVKFTE